MNHSTTQYWDTVLEHVNEIAEKENLKSRYTTPHQLYRISIDTRQDLDKLMGKVLGKQEQEQEQEQDSRCVHCNESLHTGK